MLIASTKRKISKSDFKMQKPTPYIPIAKARGFTALFGKAPVSFEHLIGSNLKQLRFDTRGACGD
jgi:hypothetical protein